MALSPITWITKFSKRLRFPQLFLLTGALFVFDLFIPDVLPFIDELLLGLMTAMLGSLKEKKKPAEKPEDPDRPAGGQ